MIIKKIWHSFVFMNFLLSDTLVGSGNQTQIIAQLTPQFLKQKINVAVNPAFFTSINDYFAQKLASIKVDNLLENETLNADDVSAWIQSNAHQWVHSAISMVIDLLKNEARNSAQQVFKSLITANNDQNLSNFTYDQFINSPDFAKVLYNLGVQYYQASQNTFQVQEQKISAANLQISNDQVKGLAFMLEPDIKDNSQIAAQALGLASTEKNLTREEVEDAFEKLMAEVDQLPPSPGREEIIEAAGNAQETLKDSLTIPKFPVNQPQPKEAFEVYEFVVKHGQDIALKLVQQGGSMQEMMSNLPNMVPNINMSDADRAYLMGYVANDIWSLQKSSVISDEAQSIEMLINIVDVLKVLNKKGARA